MRWWAGLLVGLASIGCASIGCNTATESEQPPDGPCGDDVPLVSWETFGQGFLTTYCQGCHAASSENRQDAPDSVFFDSEEDTLRWKEAILVAAVSDEPTMPPNGGPGEDDRERLSVWLTCFADD